MTDMKRRRLDDNESHEREALRELVRSLPENSFDGHTDFQTLTPEQRLAWLSRCAQFAWRFRNAQATSKGNW
jgi:Spy/CpxP family protein refolding chaperone